MYKRVEENKSRKNNSRDPVHSCALEGVVNIVGGIEDVSIVIHSPQGCAATVAQALDKLEIDFTKRKVGCTRLFETDIILGASEKLKKVIREAHESFRTSVMFIIGTCSSDIIGEDLEAVCREMEEEINCKLISINAGGFRGNNYEGMNMALDALYPLIQKKSFNVANTVNLIAPQSSINPTWQADLVWVKSVLAEMNILVNTTFCYGTNLSDIINSATASANLLLSKEVGLEFCKKMEKNFGVPTLCANINSPIGFAQTADWLMEIAKFFGKEQIAQKIIKREEDRVLDVLRKRAMMMIPRYRNCKCVLVGDSTICNSLLKFVFEDLEMIPQAIVLKYSTPQGEELLKKELDKLNLDTKIILNADGFDIKDAIKNIDTDMVIGSAWEKYLCEEFDVKIAVDLFEPTNRITYINKAFLGYDGMLNILECIAADWEYAFRSKKIDM